MPLPLVSHLLTNLWILCNIHGSEVAKLIESRGKHRERESVGEAFLQVLQFTQWHLVLLRNKSVGSDGRKWAFLSIVEGMSIATTFWRASYYIEDQYRHPAL